VELAVQDNLVPGETPAEKLANVAACGIEAIEPWFSFIEAAGDEFAAALRDSPVRMRSVCDDPRRNLGIRDDTHTERFGAALHALDRYADLGAETVISIGVFGPADESHPWDAEADTYVEVLQRLGEHVASAGITMVIECLNRYETHFINTLAEGATIARRVDLPNVKIMADFFHMNLEESDMVASMREVGDLLAHVHLADSNRFVPGRGHTDFAPCLRYLKEFDYAGVLAMECCLGPSWQLLGHHGADFVEELSSAAAYIRSLLAD
jgi:sugar phosphate isomerase/epimerase